MEKKLGRRSISISGGLYEKVRKYCEENNISASGLVTNLLVNYLEHGGDASLSSKESLKNKRKERVIETSKERDEKKLEEEKIIGDVIKESAISAKKSTHRVLNLKIHPPKATTEPDRRGPGFMPLPKGKEINKWRVIAGLELFRDSSDDALNGAITLLQNLVHKRLIESAGIFGVEKVEE